MAVKPSAASSGVLEGAWATRFTLSIHAGACFVKARTGMELVGRVSKTTDTW